MNAWMNDVEVEEPLQLCTAIEAVYRIFAHAHEPWHGA